MKAKIISNKRFKGSYWHCILSCPLISKKAKPGQFINMQISQGLRPFLRRPFSIHNIDKERIEILYQVIGEGTKLLSARKPRETLDVIGPLGNGFQLPRDKRSVFIIVGGGIGVAPLLYLSKKIKSENKFCLIGAKTKKEILCEKEFKDAGCNVRISTDDGSTGFKGRVTDLLKYFLNKNRSIKADAVKVYACGPKPMLEAVSHLSVIKGIKSQVSLEEHMSCGIGACLGCVVKTKNGLERVCKEGPVFFAQDLIWSR